MGNGDGDPCRSETPENFITKNEHVDYVAEGGQYASQILWELAQGCPPQKYLKYNVL